MKHCSWARLKASDKSYADGQASALYGYKPPLVNPVRKPGEWQTYDVIFEAPKWDADGNLLKKAYITVLLNGSDIVCHIVNLMHVQFTGCAVEHASKSFSNQISNH